LPTRDPFCGIGTIELQEDRLNVLGLWWEPGVRPTRTRLERLERELDKLARFAGVSAVALKRSLRTVTVSGTT
jgi:uncharacterized protein YcaQ